MKGREWGHCVHQQQPVRYGSEPGPLGHQLCQPPGTNHIVCTKFRQPMVARFVFPLIGRRGSGKIDRDMWLAVAGQRQAGPSNHRRVVQSPAARAQGRVWNLRAEYFAAFTRGQPQVENNNPAHPTAHPQSRLAILKYFFLYHFKNLNWTDCCKNSTI